MIFSIIEKFSQNPHLKEKLFSVTQDHFVEASPSDAIWGIGMPEHKARVTSPENWNGQKKVEQKMANFRRK